MVAPRFLELDLVEQILMPQVGQEAREPRNPRLWHQLARVRLQYDPPAGKTGAIVAWLFGHDPAAVIREDMRRFKQLTETGEVPTTEGQPRGRA